MKFYLTKIITFIFQFWSIVFCVVLVDQIGKSIWASYKININLANYVWWIWLLFFILYSYATKDEKKQKENIGAKYFTIHIPYVWATIISASLAVALLLRGFSN